MKHGFLEPIQVGKQTIKNRIVFLAMAKCLSGFDGKVTTKDLAYVEAIAKGGAGLIIPGSMTVDDQWPSRVPMQPGIYSDVFLPGLTLLAKAAHDNGAKILFQLWHGGQVDYTGSNPPTINDISVEEIHRIQGKYIDAAKRAVAAGADGIEYQTCHTYLANQFLSPLWNHRTDSYGWDTLENRSRFAVECISAIREAIGPDKILAVKMQGFDFPAGEGPDGNDGITPEMAAELAPLLEKAGADLLSVSAGGTLTGKDNIMTGDVHRAEGWKVPACRKVKATVSVPVVATGNIRHPDYVDGILADGSCDMVGMGRGLLAEHEWVKKCEEGREEQLRICISCMQCWNVEMFMPDVSNCSVNPFACREKSIRPLRCDGNGRVVVIVGAGPAGMEAAVTLKQRGFAPIVLEKRSEIGGNLDLAKAAPDKGKFQWTIDYYKNMAKALELDVRLNTEATVEGIRALEPYCVLIATGTTPVDLPVEGMSGETVLQAYTVLEERMKFQGKQIMVIGGGLTGLDTALYLREQGNEVSVVDFAPMLPLFGGGADQRYTMEGRLDVLACQEQGIALLYENKVLGYANGKLAIEGVNDAVRKELPADYVVLSVGTKAADGLWGELMAAGVQNVWKTGSANVPTAKIYKAVMNGSKFAYALK